METPNMQHLQYLWLSHAPARQRRDISSTKRLTRGNDAPMQPSEKMLTFGEATVRPHIAP